MRRVLPGGTGAHGPLTNRRQARYFHVMEAISREGLQQTIDAEIKSLEESVRALKLRRNALSPSVKKTSRPMVGWRSKLVGLWSH